MKEHFDKLKSLIQEAEAEGILKENEGLSGFSGKKMQGTLQRMAAELTNEKNCYLEVGVFQGLTLLSVGSVAKGEVIGIDNFAFFDKEGKNQSIVNSRIKKLELENVTLINADYEDALHNLEDQLKGRKVSVFFIDGPHDYRSQLVCLLFIKPFLSENAVIIIDDCNYNSVRQANADFLVSHPEFKLFYQNYTSKHPRNMSQGEKHEALDGWWNGINVIVKDKDNFLRNEMPFTTRSRKLFEGDIHIHTGRFPDAALTGMHLAEAYYSKWLRGIFHFNLQMIKYFFKSKSNAHPEFFESNTNADHLTEKKFNESLTK